jgi:hypothetical protein
MGSRSDPVTVTLDLQTELLVIHPQIAGGPPGRRSRALAGFVAPPEFRFLIFARTKIRPLFAYMPFSRNLRIISIAEFNPANRQQHKVQIRGCVGWSGWAADAGLWSGRTIPQGCGEARQLRPMGWVARAYFGSRQLLSGHCRYGLFRSCGRYA